MQNPKIYPALGILHSQLNPHNPMTYDKLPTHYFSKEIKKYIRKGRSYGLVYGNFGAFNSGDEAILKGELLELEKIPTTTVTVVSRFPEQVKKTAQNQSHFL